jgi:hypothetical protein
LARRAASRLSEFDAFVRGFIEDSHAGFDHDRSLTVGASEIEKCARATAYKKSGTPQDDGYSENPGFAHRGNILEDHWFAPLATKWYRGMKAKLLYAGQQNQMSIVAEEAHASATPDGVAIKVPANALHDLKGGDAFQGGELLNEFKSIDPNVNVARLPRPWHAGQVNYGLGLVRAATDHRPKFGLLWYGNCSELTKITRFVIPFHKGKFRQQLERAKLIMSARKKPEQLAPEGKINGGKECETCPFAHRCLGFAAWVPKGERALKSRDRSRVAKLAEEVEDSKKKIAEAEQLRRDKEATLKATLTELGTNSAEIGQTKIQWSRTEGSERLDQAKMLKKLIAHGYKRSQFTTKGKPSDRLDISN